MKLGYVEVTSDVLIVRCEQLIAKAKENIEAAKETIKTTKLEGTPDILDISLVMGVQLRITKQRATISLAEKLLLAAKKTHTGTVSLTIEAVDWLWSETNNETSVC